MMRISLSDFAYSFSYTHLCMWCSCSAWPDAAAMTVNVIVPMMGVSSCQASPVTAIRILIEMEMSSCFLFTLLPLGRTMRPPYSGSSVLAFLWLQIPVPTDHHTEWPDIWLAGRCILLLFSFLYFKVMSVFFKWLPFSVSLFICLPFGLWWPANFSQLWLAVLVCAVSVWFPFAFLSICLLF